MDAIQQFGLEIIYGLQTFSPTLDGPMHFFSFLGGAEFFLVLLPLVYWTLDKRIGIRTFLVLLSTYLLIATAKLLLHQPRPYWLEPVLSLATEPDYGIPSGHAGSAIVVFGSLAVYYPRRWLRMAAGALIILIGLSRLYLGVHFPHDVLAGWLLGAAMLFLFARWAEPLAAWLIRPPFGAQLALVFAASLAVLPLAWWIQHALLNTPDPESWRQFSEFARSPSHFLTVSGALFGAASGYLLMKRHAPFAVSGPWTQRAARYLLGVFGAALLFFGLDSLFAQLAGDETTLGYVLRFVRYAAATFWVTFIAPWLFLRLRLAPRVPDPEHRPAQREDEAAWQV